MEDGAKHTLVLYNCKVPQTGEVAFSAANAKCSANLKVKGERFTLGHLGFEISFFQMSESICFSLSFLFYLAANTNVMAVSLVLI